MGSYEASSMIYAKVKNIDPDNASKIMGYILLQDLAEKDLMRLACGPDSLLHALVVRAKIHLNLSSNTSSAPASPSPLNPISRPNPFSQSSPRLVSNGFPSSPSSSPWLSNNSPNSNHILSYASSSSFAGDGELIDESQLSDYLSFLSEDASQISNGGDAHFHRRSFSASDASFGSDEFSGPGGFKPCLYFARGFCKNGSGCKFAHGGFGDGAEVGSPGKFDGGGFEHYEEAVRMKLAAAQQQRLMAGLSPSFYNKYMNFLLQQQQQHDPQRAMMGDEIYKLGRCRPERNDFLSMASFEKMNSASRQIYLTFPAESTFKDEDVSEYFNKFGPVQDVRIPYQQKRMFGFVTFVHPETVRYILSKGNPHFICESRVLVKPYKEKGKILDKRQQQHQQQQIERGDYSSCLSPSALDRENYDLPSGGRMFYSAQEILFRRKLEQQAELQQAIDIQGRRLMNLQLPEFKNDRLHHHQRSLSVGASVHLQQSLSLGTQNHNSSPPFDSIEQEIAEGHDHQHEEALISGLDDRKEQIFIPEDLDLHKDVEQALPDNLFASPTKSAGENRSDFITADKDEIDERPTSPNKTN